MPSSYQKILYFSSIPHLFFVRIASHSMLYYQVLIILILFWSMKDYYKVLGISHKTPPEEIKKAYHILAAQFHPDKNNGDDARFKEVVEAYRVLSTEDSKTRYDKKYHKQAQSQKTASDVAFKTKVFLLTPILIALLIAVVVLNMMLRPASKPNDATTTSDTAKKS
jgi:curved DNA-binding protein CbpA